VASKLGQLWSRSSADVASKLGRGGLEARPVSVEEVLSALGVVELASLVLVAE